MLFDFLVPCRKDHPAWETLRKYRFAHRGYHFKPSIPENSLPAFKRAIERGWGAELDVHILKDGTLAVFHDSQLKRCAGVEGVIEDLDMAGLADLRLEGTDEPVPLFDEVLELFEDATPLIIELKTYKGNHYELAKAVCERLDSYKGDFCIESFDPRAVEDVKKLRPDICRGQLSMKFIGSEADISWYKKIILQNLWMNRQAEPDFIAYQYTDRASYWLRRAKAAYGVQEVSWTVRSKADMEKLEADGCICIFEKFNPDRDEAYPD